MGDFDTMIQSDEFEDPTYGENRAELLYGDEDDEDDGQPDEMYEWESSLASVGWGTDEDYGYYGGGYDDL